MTVTDVFIQSLIFQYVPIILIVLIASFILWLFFRKLLKVESERSLLLQKHVNELDGRLSEIEKLLKEVE